MTTATGFVNIFGQPVDVTPIKAKKQSKPKEAYHKGWLAVGVSPEALAAAKRSPDFVLESFLRNAKMEKIRVKPYFSASSAHEACELAMRCGWMIARVVEMKAE